MAFCILTKLLLICFGIATILTISTASDDEFFPEVEPPAIPVLVKPLGEREYLAPNLLSLINLAKAHLPEKLKLINVLEASREITNHVRYDLIIKAIDSSDTEVICHIVVKEKPWLRSSLNEKYRIVDYTNCSSYYNREEFGNEETYEPVTYNRRNKDISYNDLIEIESQIFPKTQNTKDNVEVRAENSKEFSRDALDILGSLFDIHSPEKEKEENINKEKESGYENPKIRMKRNVEKLLPENNINRVLLEKGDYGNLKVFLEEILHNAITDTDKYRITNAFDVLTQNTIEEPQEIMIEVTNSQGNKKSCSVKIDPSEESEKKDLKIALYCPNLVDVTVYPNTMNVKPSKFKKRKLVNHASSLFSKYQLKYNKSYNDDEKAERFSIFEKNLALIDDLNESEQGTAIYGITEFADMTELEYKQRTGLLVRKSQNDINNILADIPNFKLPPAFDWRKRGAVSKVKNQGSCGSCWAFSVIGNIEGLHAIKSGKLEEYSEQELLDCDTIDSACRGGLPDDAYKAIEQLGGLELESEYPYKAEKDKCVFNQSLVHAKIKGAVDLPKNETAMALWLMANGPISIGINANAMQFYRGGISHPWKLLCRPGSLDHGVLIVGFGIKEYPRFNKTLPYWIIKNSWGDRWGEQGYYRVYRGDNTCGVNGMASSAVLA